MGWIHKYLFFIFFLNISFLFLNCNKLKSDTGSVQVANSELDTIENQLPKKIN